jgi:hypothetical protein
MKSIVWKKSRDGTHYAYGDGILIGHVLSGDEVLGCYGCAGTGSSQTVVALSVAAAKRWMSDIYYAEQSRERFEAAKAAMQGYLASNTTGECSLSPKGVANWAVDYADHLIAQLKADTE